MLAQRWRLLVTVAVVLVCAAVVARRPVRLGLDLKGGVHLVLEAQETPGAPVTEESLERALTVVRRRVDGLGVAEPVIQRQGARRIVVELPGVVDPRQAREVLGRTALLEFRSPEGRTELTGAHLVRASLSRDQLGRPAVALEFDSEGARRFEEMTRRYLGLQIPIVLDGEVLSSPVVRSVITGGRAQIEGDFTVEEARQLVVLLNAGALPVPLQVVEERSVGPVLGRESIQLSVRAGAVGVVMVLAYMAAYYRAAGLLADVALGIYLLVLVAVLVALRATLTLPGIAGLFLSAGMAVDGNVLIFERIREELRAGKGARAAVQAGFAGSLRTIVDSNVTTLIAALALFYFGTGPIRGFAVTLSLGIVVSMFSAVVITRFLIDWLVRRDPDRAARQLLPRGVRAA
ncbi:MAG TPA: protein translocase subunit SecD [Limnochordales bacterium]